MYTTVRHVYIYSQCFVLNQCYIFFVFSSVKTSCCLWGQKPIIAERLWCHWGQQTIWYQWSDQHASGQISKPLCMRSTMRPHDIVTPTDLVKINQVKKANSVSLRNGNWFFCKRKRSDKPPLIPWKYEVNTLKCILPLSWCIQMGSDNIESRATTYDDTQTNHGEIFASTVQ